MRKPPIPRAVPHRPLRERWAAAGACGVLAVGHATRAVVDAQHVAYLSVLDGLCGAAAIAAAVQLARVDDEISWGSAAGVAALLGTATIASLTLGFPGMGAVAFGPAATVTLAACAYVLFRSTVVLLERRRDHRVVSLLDHPSVATRRERLRTPRPARLAARARRGTAPAPAARRGPARPAA